MKHGRWSSRFALIPIAIMVAMVVVLAILEVPGTIGSPILLPILNTILITVVSIASVILATSSFLRFGSWPNLLLGGGLVSFALANLAGGWLTGLLGPNTGMTSHNVEILLSSLLFSAGGLLSLRKTEPQREPQRLTSVVALYFGLMVSQALLVILSYRGVMPPFFLVGVGPTLLREIIIGLAAGLFFLAALLYFVFNRQAKSDFLYWYILGLVLLAIGLVSLLFGTAIGDTFAWLGRLCQYFASTYFLIGLLAARAEAKASGSGLAETIANLFREPVASYGLISDASRDALISTDSEGRILLWNATAETMFGYARHEALQLLITDLFALEHADYLTRELQTLTQMAEDSVVLRAVEEEKEEEFRAKKKDGTTFPTSLSISARKTPRGWVTVVFVKDISERKKAEEALRQAHLELEGRVQERTKQLAEVNIALEAEVSERKQAQHIIDTERQRFNDVLEMLPAYVVLLTMDYHVPFANRFFSERFGESHGKRCFEYLFGRSEPCDNCETYTVARTKKPHHWEWTGPDGRNYDIFDFPFTDTDGSPLIMEMGIDITEQKRAQEALRKAHEELEVRVHERTRELRETRDYLDNLFNYANAPIIVWNSRFEITRFNHAFEEITGRKADEVLGKNVDILIPADNRIDALNKIKRTARKGERWEVVEIPIQHINGSIRTLLWNSAPIFAADGKTAVATIAQGQDITERKRAEQALRESEGDLGRAQIVAHVGSWRLDARSNELLWSDETYRIFGVPKGTPMTYERFLSMVHPDDREYVDRRWTAALRGESYDIEHRIIVRGEIRWVREKAELEFDGQGVLRGGFGTVQDITERKWSEEQYRTIVSTAMDGFWLTDAEGKILDVNDSYCRLTGYSREELLTMTIADLEAVEAPHETARHIERVREKGYDRFETRHHNRNGQIIDVEVSVNFVRDEGGRFFVFIRDITERKKAEQLKDEFIGLVSHELRTPLTVIGGSLRTAMSEGVAREDGRELLQNAAEGVDSLTAILENMLELSRYQAGRLQLRIERVSIADAVHNVIGKLKLQGVSQVYSSEIPGDLPSVEADPVRVERILFNLMENAAKYSPEDSRITVSGRTQDGFVIISVIDRGPGISPDDQARIFEPFQQLGTSQHEAKGVGLGLVVCKRLAEAQGGWVRVDSEPGKGSTFSFALPEYRMR